MHYPVWKTGSDVLQATQWAGFIPAVPLSSEGMNSALCLYVKSSAVAEGLPVSLLQAISVVFSSPYMNESLASTKETAGSSCPHKGCQ